MKTHSDIFFWCLTQMDIRAQTAILCAVQKLLPAKTEGRPRSNPTEMLDGMCYILWIGAPWRSLGSRFSTIHGTFIRWSRARVFEQAYRALLKLDRRTTSRKNRFACIDSTFVKNVYGRDCVGRNPIDRGRNATKVSALVDQDGIPLSLVFFPGNISDQRTVHRRVCEPDVSFGGRRCTPTRGMTQEKIGES
jgi:transposase